MNRLKSWMLSLPGWHTSRKIVVFESDDWGSLRVPSDSVFDRLTHAGLDLISGDSFRYNRYDTLESAEDLESLFETLTRFRDVQGNHPVFTAFCLVANPDFEKIVTNKFQSYEWEPVPLTFEKHYGNARSFHLWQEGRKSNLFIPEFHGREHLNVAQWMQALQGNDPQARLAFQNQVWGYNNQNPFDISFQAAFDVGMPEEVVQHAAIVTSGLQLFEKLIGSRASAFVPPNGIMHANLYPIAAAGGVKYVFSAQRNVLAIDQGRHKAVWNYLGKRNSAGQRYIIRNAFFEPSDQSKDWVKECLRQVQQAFSDKRPAVIGSHRVNYIGNRDKDNRQVGLNKLSVLLERVIKQWPEVEFMSTRQLGELMEAA